MLQKIRSFITSLTEAKSKNEDEARREYMIKVFMLVIFSVVTVVFVLLSTVFTNAVLENVVVLSVSWFALGLIIYINYKGGWKFSLYVPTFVFLFISVWGIFNFGYEMMNLMEFTILIFVTTLFLSKGWQWLVVFLSVIAIGLFNWTIYPGDYFNLVWEIIAHFGFFGILIGIMSFYSGQFQKSLDRSRYLQEFFHSTLRSLPGIFYVFDKNGILSQWNENFEKMTGYIASEIGKLNPTQIFKSEKMVGDQTLLEKLFKKKRKTVEMEILTKDKEEIPHLITGLRTEIMGEEFLIGEGVDITEQKKAEAKAESLNEIRKSFIHVVSHQLRTPLTVVRWTMDSLKNENFGKLNKNQKEFVDQSARASAMVVGRINDLLTTLEIEEQKVFLRKEDFSLAEIWKNVSPRVLEICDRKNLRFVEEVEKDLPLVNVDKGRIENAMWQFANNGANYTKEGSVKIQFSKIGKFVRFLVEDTGIGIPEDSRDKLFTKFFRGSNAETVFEDASGIGLYITKFFIEQHGGKVGYETELGKGSKFWFDLPIS